MKPTDALGLLLCALVAPAAAAPCRDYGGVPPGFAAAQGGEPNRAGLVAIAGGRFRMGSNEGYPEEREVHEVRVGPFSIDRHEVTNAQFERFVQATGYVTRAERGQDADDLPGATGERLPPGSAVFVPPRGGEHLRGAYAWWKWMPGADWRHPAGPGSDIRSRGNHPVVQVAFEDALAYARWLGRDLPTEAQWEYAARGGLDGAAYAWGNTPDNPDKPMANTWQGRFPFIDRGEDGHKGTAPVGCYPANGFGLQDMVGNAWEWTRDFYRERHDTRRSRTRWSCRCPGRVRRLPRASSRAALSSARRTSACATGLLLASRRRRSSARCMSASAPCSTHRTDRGGPT